MLQNFVQTSRKFGRIAAVGFLLAMAIVGSVGCAKFPKLDPGDPASTRLIFTVSVEQPISPNYIYMVAINTSRDRNPTTLGPIPTIAPPWGNGFVAGNVQYFIRWDPLQSPQFLIYEFPNPNDLTQFREVGTPVSFQPWQQGDRSLRFEIDLTQIARSQMDAEQIETIQVNILTMDRVPQGSESSKIWDALGDGRNPVEINSPINIPVKTVGIYDNARFNNLEPVGDCVEPSLDLADFRIEVRIN